MSRNATSRLKLIAESDDELIDQFEYNWPILDLYAGALMVNDGDTPSDSSLFDGCFVSERTSGRLWMAQKNQNTGAFDKVWIIYPWNIEASCNYDIKAVSNTDVALSAVDATQSVGYPAPALSAGKIVIPIAGIYAVWFTADFDAITTAPLTYVHQLKIAGALNDGTEMVSENVANAKGGDRWEGNFFFNAGDTIGVYPGDLGGRNLTVWFRIGVTMITPI